MRTAASHLHLHARSWHQNLPWSRYGEDDDEDEDVDVDDDEEDVEIDDDDDEEDEPVQGKSYPPAAAAAAAATGSCHLNLLSPAARSLCQRVGKRWRERQPCLV